MREGGAETNDMQVGKGEEQDGGQDGEKDEGSPGADDEGMYGEAGGKGEEVKDEDVAGSHAEDAGPDARRKENKTM